MKAASAAKVLGWSAIPLAMALAYLMMMVGLTTSTYRLAAAQRVHAALLERNTMLRSREAVLESVQNLEDAARKLHMSEPRKVAFVSMPSPAVPVPHRFAFFVQIIGVTRWLGVR